MKLIALDGGKVELLADALGHESVGQIKTFELGLPETILGQYDTDATSRTGRTSSLGRQYTNYNFGKPRSTGKGDEGVYEPPDRKAWYRRPCSIG